MAAERAESLGAHADEQPSSDARLAVVAADVHVEYRIFDDQAASLRQLARRAFRPRRPRRIHALRGVSLTASSGEVVGIVGANGSGKSTLLTAIAGLVPLASGTVYTRTPPTVLGVNAALNAQLSGRRNVYLGCLALGMKRDEIDARFDEIVEFSGLGEYIEFPMRAYSSGMRARLQFSIASAVTPEILMIDEALAVGDDEFKERSRARIEELRDAAGTIFFVSHNSHEVKRLCSRALWLHEGRLLADGEPTDVLREYAKVQRARIAAGQPI